MDKIIDLDTGWDLLKDTLDKEIDKPVKSVMAKRVTGTLDGSGCFGCPPNGDGTRVNGEPDGRCKGDGGGKESDGKGTVSKVEPTDRIKEIDDEVKTLEKSLNGTDADIQKWGDQLEKELGIKGDEKDKAARAFAEQENRQRLSSLLKEKKDLEDEIELDNWAKSLENEIGISADKSMQIVRPFPESQKIFEEEKTKLRKQTLAKRECLGCPPNGDGTTAKGEPDRRCKGDGAGKGADSEVKKSGLPKDNLKLNPGQDKSETFTEKGMGSRYDKDLQKRVPMEVETTYNATVTKDPKSLIDNNKGVDIKNPIIKTTKTGSELKEAMKNAKNFIDPKFETRQGTIFDKKTYNGVSYWEERN